MGRITEAEDSVDNYAVFVARLDIAIHTLRHRQDLIDQTAPIVALLHGQNEVGDNSWSRRRAQVEVLLSGYGGSPEGYGNLSDLLQSAQTLERKFEDRTRRLDSRMTSIENRRSDIEKSLLDLQRSKDKLAMSLELTREREALNRTISALDDGPGNSGFVPEDTGVAMDLRNARQAVVLAEALLELKGHQGS